MEFDVLDPPRPDFGDYSSNVAMILAKRLRRKPIEIAEEIAEELSHKEEFDRIESIMPGYINVFLSQKVLHNIVERAVAEDVLSGVQARLPQKVLVEFISSTPTGPIHLGNARGGPAGDTFSRVLEAMGHTVYREFYVNDYGKQVEVLGHSVLQDEESQYRGEYLSALMVEKPENLTGPFEVGAWASEKIMETHIRPTCEKLGIVFDNFFSEKSLHEDGLVGDMLVFLESRGLVYKREGASWYKATELGDEKDRVVVRSDGKPTYRLADFAYHKNKFDRGFDRLITFLGADHLGEAREMKAFIERVLDKRGVYGTVLTQFVRVMRDGKEVKMSKRNGTYYAMDDLIDEVGVDAVRFIFLSYTANSHITFDIDLAKERSEKNPVYYVQYAHARIASILKKAEDDYKGDADLSLLNHPKERELMKRIMRFADVVELVGENYETHRLPHYARELADTFHSFYAVCRVIDPEDTDRSKARLVLVRGAKKILAQALDLCGVSAPEKM